MTKTVNILGTNYTIVWVDRQNDSYISENDLTGFCDSIRKKLVIANSKSIPGREDLNQEEHYLMEKMTIRHEIIHAFFYESGLWADSSSVNGPWAMHEEMIDWFTLQGPKIVKVWESVYAL